MERPILGIIGGSGLYDIEGIQNQHVEQLDTPFGAPSGAYLCGELEGASVVFLARHGTHHNLLPTEINYRANIYGMRLLGVRTLLSVSAVGSLRDGICPGDMVLPDQFIDRTRRRENTFFGEGIVAHIQFGDPVCPDMLDVMSDVLQSESVRYHRGGTYVAMEGPAFSTRAESNLYRSWGADVIGMTSLPEAKLAREAEMCYLTLAMSTDYDCWHQSEQEVSADAVLKVIEKNIAVSKRAIRAFARRMPIDRTCRCRQSLDGAMLTRPENVPHTTRKRLELLVERFLKV